MVDWALKTESITRSVLSQSGHAAGFFFVNLGSFSYTSRAAFIFMQGLVSLTHPVLASFLSGEFLLHIPCCLHFMSSVGSFSLDWVSLKHHMLASFLCGEFPSHISCWLWFYLGSFSYTSCAWLLFLSGEFLLHIPCLLYFSLGSFSYTSLAGRRVSTLLRLIDDIRYQQNVLNKPGLLVTIDYFHAFDCISKDFMINVFQKFGLV